MCLGGISQPFHFMSVYAGFQEKMNTHPNLHGNYHFWVRDTKTGKIIDPTPDFDGTCEDWDTGKRHYFKYSPMVQKKKCDELWDNQSSFFGGKHNFMKRCELIGKLKQYKKGKCFMNAIGYMMAHQHQPELLLEGGACGYEIDNFNHCSPFPEIKRGMRMINLDWGY